MTVPELAQRWRVGEAKIRGLIQRGELRAFNASGSLCRRPRWVIMPESVAQYEMRWSSAPPAPRPAKRPAGRDYYPD
jgi:Helix-turn-helix domain